MITHLPGMKGIMKIIVIKTVIMKESSKERESCCGKFCEKKKIHKFYCSSSRKVDVFSIKKFKDHVTLGYYLLDETII